IIVTDLQGRLEDVNPKTCEILGYSREELIGRDVRTLIPPEELARTPLRIDAMMTGKTILVERVLRRRDGTAIPVEISARRLDERRLQGIYRDISERKRTEEELRQALSLLEATLDSTSEGTLVVDLAGKITRFNSRFLEIWNLPPEIVASRDDNNALTF